MLFWLETEEEWMWVRGEMGKVLRGEEGGETGHLVKNSHFKKDVLSRHMIKQKPSKIYQVFLF